ncbi:MAG: diguanylate cyclase [Rhodocyclales bacterium GWA2_65_20]|nr:MAG: diguanylate cyclase [Rhodocyclales bacterium GWA2_65_20]
MVSGATLERLMMSTHSAPVQFADAPWLTQENLRAFIELYQRRNLSAVFQPILDFRAHGYLGFEGLIRGPAGTSLHSPHVLFGLARESGLTTDFERLCREVVLREFARLRLPGLLFLNVSVSCLADPNFTNGNTQKLLDQLGLSTRQIVIELTENQHVSDFSALRDVLTGYRKHGYEFAVDDLGEGFSNLRIWSEVRPEYVKIDRHFISGIADDALKFQLVKAMHEISDTCHVHLIAEGIETEAEFATVRDLGIVHGQGFLIARPDPLPQTEPTAAVRQLLKRSSVIMFPRSQSAHIGGATARKLLLAVEPVQPHDENEKVFARFERDPALVTLPVVSAEGQPLGLINRYSLVDRFALPFRRELYGKKPCTMFMDPQPIVVDHAVSVQEIGQVLGQSSHHHLIDGFVITEEGRYIGIGSSQALMSLITDMQIHAARYANPLTQLPGNVPINEHIDRLIDSGVGFTACYCDLDHFKPYNDTYGYRKGDGMIQLLGGILAAACDARLDFVGHIGGDDFMVLLQSHDWQERMTHALRTFDYSLGDFLDADHIGRGGYHGEDRRGQPVFHALPALSIGCLVVEPAMFQSHHDVSSAVTEAKKQAKKMPGSAIFIERRRLAPQLDAGEDAIVVRGIEPLAAIAGRGAKATGHAPSAN